MEHAYSLHFRISQINLKKNEVEGILTDTLETLDGIETKIAFSPEFINELTVKLKLSPFRNTTQENIVHFITGLNKTLSYSGENKNTHELTIYYKKTNNVESAKNSYHREKIFLNEKDAKIFDRKTTIIK